MNVEEKIALMFDLAEKQQAAANAAIQRLEKTSQSMSKVIEQSVQTSIEKTAVDATKDAAHTIISEINRVSQSAQQIADQLYRTSETLSVKLFAMVGIVTAACLLALFGIYLWLGSDVHSLRAEQLQLQANIAALESAGGLANLSTCDGRPCIKIDTNAPTYGSNHEFRIIAR